MEKYKVCSFKAILSLMIMLLEIITILLYSLRAGSLARRGTWGRGVATKLRFSLELKVEQRETLNSLLDGYHLGYGL